MNLNYFFFYIGSNLTIIYTDYATGFEMRLIANNSKATCLWANILCVARREENKLPFFLIKTSDVVGPLVKEFDKGTCLRGCIGSE